MAKFTIDLARSRRGQLRKVADRVVEDFPPRGWKIELAIRLLPGDFVEIETSDPVTTTTSAFPDYERSTDEDYFIYPLYNELHNDPGFPYDYGRTEEEALYNWTLNMLETALQEAEDYFAWVEQQRRIYG